MFLRQLFRVPITSSSGSSSTRESATTVNIVPKATASPAK